MAKCTFITRNIEFRLTVFSEIFFLQWFQVWMIFLSYYCFLNASYGKKLSFSHHTQICFQSAMLNTGEEVCYIGLGASHADCANRNEGRVLYFQEPEGEILLWVLRSLIFERNLYKTNSDYFLLLWHIQCLYYLRVFVSL